ncbi:hypothetical protein LSTR_LSTR012008 [Laodelphax striatellus]|uniref:Uncharacterized protein n=1 Tax=Laodelphax striatellus TaxID=195883 RepID=A0A482WGW7_LAOST|nr:hypothetical protein LSTR_LSTR012008 [Laodelphax striatellus]
MRFLRRIIGKNRRDRIRNETVRNELEVRPVSGLLEERQLKWLGHAVEQRKQVPGSQTRRKTTKGRTTTGVSGVLWRGWERCEKELAGDENMMENRAIWRGWIEAQNHPTLRGRSEASSKVMQELLGTYTH